MTKASRSVGARSSKVMSDGNVGSGKYKNLLVNTALFAINSIATKLISFILVPLYTTYLTAGEYGITDMSLTVIGLVTPLVTLSAADAAVRYIVADREHGDRYTTISFILTLLSVVVVAFLSPLLDLEVFGGLGAYRGWFILAYATSALLSLCGEVERGYGEVRFIAVCAGISSLVTLFSALLLIGALGLGVTGYFASVSVGPIVAIAVYLFAGKVGSALVQGMRALSHFGASAVREAIAPMVRYALPLIPNALFWWVGTSISRLFITGMLGIASSGMYAAASKVPNLLNTAYSVFQQAWQLSAFQESEHEGVDKFFETVFRLLQGCFTVLCALISFLAPWLAGILLRGETFDAWPMISVLLIANLMNVFNSFFGTIYTSTMHTSYIMRTTVVGALCCVVLTPILIVPAGTFGACAASAIAQGVVFLLRAFDSRKYVLFDVGWRYLIPTIFLLIGQSIVTACQVDGWQAVSGCVLIAVSAIQVSRLMPDARALYGAVRNRASKR